LKPIYNFSAGPAVLPQDVLKKAQAEMLDYQGSGMSVMEMSHRSKWFDDIINDATRDLKELLNVPDNYKILFLQGGGHTQFSMVPLNLMKNGKAEYVLTGEWSERAYKEAQKYGEVYVLASSADVKYSYIPEVDESKIHEDSDYVYICENNTIYGTVYHETPKTAGKVLISDMSSCILSEPVDVSKYGLIFAGAQKNIGPAGTVIVIIREDLLRDDIPSYTPTMLNYKIHADKNSLYNTPPTYGIYICGLVFKWLKDLGGLEKMEAINLKKAAVLYDFIDSSDYYIGNVKKEDRSIMNVTFHLKDRNLEDVFVKESTAAGLLNLKGHRSVGGLRASIYNAMSLEGVLALVEFMKEFEERHQ